MWQGQRQGRPPSGQGSGNRAKVIAVAAATTVVLAGCAGGFLVLGGGDKDGNADGGGMTTEASASASRSATASPSDDPRGKDGKPAFPGWKVVINSKWGTAFDVPPDWDVKPPSLLIGFTDDKVEDGSKPLIVMSAPAILKESWCASDDDKDGRVEDTGLAAAGTKGADGAKNTGQVAVNQVFWWVYGGYTQPDKKSITHPGRAKPYTTRSGIKGSISRAWSRNTPRQGKCASDGKAITFGFKNSAGHFVAWNLYGATGVKDELPDSTIMKILSTVRLHGDPTES
jgi:hypothetical protein